MQLAVRAGSACFTSSALAGGYEAFKRDKGPPKTTHVRRTMICIFKQNGLDRRRPNACALIAFIYKINNVSTFAEIKSVVVNFNEKPA